MEDVTTPMSVVLVAPIERSGLGGGQARAGLLLAKYLIRHKNLRLHVVQVPHRVGGQSLAIRVAERIGFYGRYLMAVMRHRPVLVHLFSPCTSSGLAEKSALATIGSWFGAYTLLNFRNDPRLFFAKLSCSEARVAVKRVQKFTHVLCQAHDLGEYFVQEFSVPSERVFVVANGIEPIRTVITDAEIERRLVQRRILFIGGICHRKGLDVLLDAAGLIGDKFGWLPEIDIVGDVQEPIVYSTLVEQAQNLNLMGRVNFIGPLFGRKKTEIIRRASVMVLPSRSEGFPNVILEAMQLALPCVITNVGAAGDIAHAGGVGVRMVRVEDNEALCNEINSLLDRSSYVQTSRSAETGARAFDVRLQVEGLIEIYRQIAGN